MLTLSSGGRMRTCSNCGSGLTSSDVFCTDCGTGQDQANLEHASPAGAAGGFGDQATTAVETRLEVVTESAPEYAVPTQSDREEGTASAAEQPPAQDPGSQ